MLIAKQRQHLLSNIGTLVLQRWNNNKYDNIRCRLNDMEILIFIFDVNTIQM